jgi:thiamine biosynthesis lipoprotein ApbE
MQALNLWGASTQKAGRLPNVDELKEQLKQAGFSHFSQITGKRVVVVDAFYAFKAIC